MAPFFCRTVRNCSTESSAAGIPARTASAAAVPAASPSVMQTGITRVEDCASCVAEIARPATRRLSLAFPSSAAVLDAQLDVMSGPGLDFYGTVYRLSEDDVRKFRELLEGTSTLSDLLPDIIFLSAPSHQHPICVRIQQP